MTGGGMRGAARSALAWSRSPLAVRAGDVALALAVGIGSAVAGSAVHAAPGVAAVLAVMGLALAPRRQRPQVTVVIVAVAAGVLYAARVDTDAEFPAVLVAAYSAAVHGTPRLRRVVEVGAALVGVTGVIGYAVTASTLPAVPGRVVVAAIAAWVLGGVVRSQIRARAQAAEARVRAAEQERDLAAARAVAQERARIARELHDLAAHHLSVVVVTAHAATRALDRDPAAVRRALGTVETSGRAALEEMRVLLGLLRVADSGASDTGNPGDDPVAWTPQPGLARLDALVAQVEAAGLPVTLTTAVTAPGTTPETVVPEPVDLSAFRIVQEALTNSLKHAAPTRAHVLLEHHTAHLTVTVTDTGPPAPDTDPAGPPAGPRSAPPGAGRGLLGMRERVELLGGDFTAGPHDTGFRVRARFPLPAAPSTTEER